MFPELSAVQVKALMGKLMDTYGKVIITWNPKVNGEYYYQSELEEEEED